VKRYGEVGRQIREALEQYVTDVRAGVFPDDRHTYAISEEELARFRDTVRPG
jgi:3-methyl-2-oxobutanoate hydroxymethyltransferase